MNKNLRNNLIFISILLLLVILKLSNSKSNRTSSELIYEGDKNSITKIIISQKENSIELLNDEGGWNILGNDTLIVKQERIDKQNAVFNKSSNDYIVNPDYKNVEFDDKTIGEIIDQVKLEIDAGISNEQLTTIQGEHFQQENKELEKYYNPVFTSYDKNFGINNNFTIDRSFNKKEFSEGNQTIQPYAGKTFGSLY